MTEITAKDVKALRDLTGAGMMTAKKALVETGGDVEKAVELLRVSGEAKAAKRASREASEGTIQSYIHSNGHIGVLVEIDCETDFVARNEAFLEFAHDIAVQIAATAPLALSDEDVPAEDRERETRIAAEQSADRPENMREKIAQGRVDKWLSEVVLLRQKHVNQDKYNGQTIEQLRTKVAADTGENVVIKRFARFAIGG